MKKTDITAVSFLNTLPFIYGIENSGLLENYSLRLEVPSMCAKLAIDNIPDIALIPIAAYNELNNYYILDQYCLGTEKEVKSVLLLSNKPLNKIKTIYFDEHSRTANVLIKILAEKLWKIYPEYKRNKGFPFDEYSAKVSIGDKAFKEIKFFRYSFDLAECWNKLTGLPFVFAVWIYKNKTDKVLIDNFTKSLQYGIEKIDEMINKMKLKEQYPNVDIYTYLNYNLDFNFDERKRNAFNLFLSMMNIQYKVRFKI